jgi:hypothetical protein
VALLIPKGKSNREHGAASGFAHRPQPKRDRM